MGRPKLYERTALLDAAIELFRTQGYSATSTAELVKTLGINRKSMYAEFGSKQGLFEAALERYSDHHLSPVLAPLEGPGAGLSAIQSAFDGYGSAIVGPFRGKGCLLCNTAVERAALDPGSARYVQGYLARLTAAFRGALVHAVRAGELPARDDLDALAAFFTTALIGVAACVRAEAPPEQVRESCRVVLGVLGTAA